jgi:HEAT repeat protein
MPLIRSDPKKKADKTEPSGALDGLTSPLADLRFAAARAAADEPASLPMLVQALGREGDARVREAIFTALTRIRTPESVRAVLPYLRSDTASLRTAALDALRAMPELAQSHLEELLCDPDSDVRLLACDLARTMTGAEAPRALCALIERDPEVNVCAAAVDVLSEIGDGAAIAPLARCAARFPKEAFLLFAIKVASERLSLPPICG